MNNISVNEESRQLSHSENVDFLKTSKLQMNRIGDSSKTKFWSRQEERDPCNTAARKSILERVKLQSLVAKCCKMKKILYSPVKFANFVYICINLVPRVFICITRSENNHFRSKNGYFPARNANIYKICELHRAIFFSFYNISQPNFAILLILRNSFQLW